MRSCEIDDILSIIIKFDIALRRRAVVLKNDVFAKLKLNIMLRHTDLFQLIWRVGECASLYEGVKI